MINQLNPLAKNILTTLVYYDCLDFPLTAFEIHKNLINSDYYEKKSVRKVSLHEVLHELGGQSLWRFVDGECGFYFLRGRRELIANRTKRTKLSFEKNRRLRRMVFWLRLVPFVRMVAVTGRLSMKNAQMKSDWDLLVVLRAGHIWTGRTLVTGLVQFLGKRRHGRKIQDRICLNHFITDESLEISLKDLYAANEYFFIRPLFGWKTFQKFQLKNRWIAEIKPHYGPSEIEPLGFLDDSFYSKKIRSWGEKIFQSQKIENVLRRLEKKKIMKNPKTHQKGAFIQANDESLIFWPSLKGPEVFQKFKAKMDKFL